jgi:hypothetical protein
VGMSDVLCPVIAQGSSSSSSLVPPGSAACISVGELPFQLLKLYVLYPKRQFTYYLCTHFSDISHILHPYLTLYRHLAPVVCSFKLSIYCWLTEEGLPPISTPVLILQRTPQDPSLLDPGKHRRSLVRSLNRHSTRTVCY